MKKFLRPVFGLLAAVALLIAAAFFIPRTVDVDISHMADANYLDVVAAIADIPRYPEYTEGRAEKGVITSLTESTNAQGNRVVDMKYEVWGLGQKNPGHRVYTYHLDRQEVTIDLTFYTEAVRERTATKWLVKQNGDKTLITIKGVRVTSWLFSLFSSRHNAYVVSMLSNMEQQIEAR